MLKDMIPWQI